MALLSPTASSNPIDFDNDFDLLQLLLNQANYQGKNADDFYVDAGDLFTNSLTVYGSFNHVPFTTGTINSLKFTDVASGIYFTVSGLNDLPLSTLTSALAGGIQDAMELIFQGSDTIHGTAYDDYLAGYGGIDYIYGNLGKDKIHGNAGSDNLFGSQGDDELHGDSNGDNLYGGDDADAAYGGSGTDKVHGGNGNDKLFGGSEADQLFGEAGNDVIHGEGGFDDIDGGADVDTVDYNWANLPIQVTLAGSTFATVSLNGAQQDRIKNVENVVGGSGGDVITGDGVANSLKGNGGGDTLRGGRGNDGLKGDSGNDFLFGDVGNDSISGGANGDTIDGGAGLDTATYADKSASVSVTLNGATAATVLVNGFAEDTVKNVENLVGGSAGDRFAGDAFANVFSGGAGNDSLSGLVGSDTLKGDAGDDSISGGLGVDQLWGGAGADKFAFDVKAKPANADHILDFDALDAIVVDTGVFKSIKTEVFKSKFFHVGKKAKDANDYFIFNTKTDELSYDKDGKGGKAQKLIASFDTDVDLTSADFLLI